VKSRAAQLLQINRTTLIEKLKKKSLAEVLTQKPNTSSVSS
jgi:DNA-binding NtrC family response regulator